MRGFGGLVGMLSGLLVWLSPVASPADAQDIRIDVPVVLKEAKVVLDIDHLAFEGDEPTGLQFLRVRRWSNGGLLPNVKVNAGASYRILQLVREGFVQLQP